MNDALDRERDIVLNRLMRLIAIIGSVAYVPGSLAAFLEGFWAIFVINTLAYIAIILIAFFPKTSSTFKLVVFMSGSLLIGAFVLFFTGPLGAGYIWLIVAVVISALFGRTRIVVVATSLAMTIMLAWAVFLALGGEGHGANVKTVIIISGSMFVVCLGLALVIRMLLHSLSSVLLEKSGLADSLALELKESKEIRARLEKTVILKEELVRELHHRVRNNLQIVQSLLSLDSEEEDNSVILLARRRVRALAASNDIFLSRPGHQNVDAYDLVRTVAQLALDGFDDEYCKVEAVYQNEVSLDQQTASMAAVLLSELIYSLASSSGTPAIRIESRKPYLWLLIHYPEDVDMEAIKNTVASVASGRIARSMIPDMEIGVLDPVDGLGVFMRVLLHYHESKRGL